VFQLEDEHNTVEPSLLFLSNSSEASSLRLNLDNLLKWCAETLSYDHMWLKFCLQRDSEKNINGSWAWHLFIGINAISTSSLQ
jgi:hypothetical protein